MSLIRAIEKSLHSNIFSTQFRFLPKVEMTRCLLINSNDFVQYNETKLYRELLTIITLLNLQLVNTSRY